MPHEANELLSEYQYSSFSQFWHATAVYTVCTRKHVRA